MKKLVVLALVLAISGVAGAGLALTVPASAAKDAAFALSVAPTSGQLQNVGLWVGFTGAACTIDVSALVNPTNGNPALVMDAETAAGFGFTQLFFVDTVGSLNSTTGQYSAYANPMLSGVSVTGTAAGIIAITIFDPAYAGADGQWTTFDTQSVVVTGVPEPMTIGLLSLGGLFLRRRLA